MDFPTLDRAVMIALSDSRRRITLAVLSDREQAVSLDDLAAAVVQREAATSGTDSGEWDLSAVRVSLFHLHLPRLSESGAIAYDADTGFVTDVGWRFDREWITRLIEARPDPDYDPILTALASPRRQAVLSVLLTVTGPLTEDALAAEVAAHERDCDPATVSAAGRRRTALSLTHVHLPHLETVGFVDRDTTGGIARPDAMPWRRDEWVAASPIGSWAATE